MGVHADVTLAFLSKYIVVQLCFRECKCRGTLTHVHIWIVERLVVRVCLDFLQAVHVLELLRALLFYARYSGDSRMRIVHVGFCVLGTQSPRPMNGSSGVCARTSGPTHNILLGHAANGEHNR